jgi:hypothetical protein
MFSIMGTTFSKLERLTPFNIIQQFLKVFLVQPLIFSSSPSCIESHDNKFTGGKSFFAEQIASETINFFFFRHIAFLIC